MAAKDAHSKTILHVLAPLIKKQVNRDYPVTKHPYCLNEHNLAYLD